jgi:NB-ARC domain
MTVPRLVISAAMMTPNALIEERGAAGAAVRRRGTTSEAPLLTASGPRPAERASRKPHKWYKAVLAGERRYNTFTVSMEVLRAPRGQGPTQEAPAVMPLAKRSHGYPPRWRARVEQRGSALDRLGSDRRALGTAVTLGIVSLLVAVTGGPVSALGFELPSTSTTIVRWALGVVGILLIGAGGWLWLRSSAHLVVEDSDEPASMRSSALRTGPYQLPRDIPDFTGRGRTVSRLVELLAQRPDRRGTALPVVAIDGQAGVGKSTLAVHVAHIVRGQYPDGQLYADLRDARGEPLEAARVLGDFLLSLGVPRADIPDEDNERVRRYRELLSTRRVLIVLDDASSEAQVRPLIPGGVGCGVLVTSRRQLAALDGAHHQELDVLEPDAAVELLASVIGRERVTGERDAAITVRGGALTVRAGAPGLPAVR